MPKYEIILYWSWEDQVFVAEVPELPGCMAHGDTPEKALKNVKRAVQLWVETAREFGDPIPEPNLQRVKESRDEIDLKLMRLAIEEAAKSTPHHKRDPKVGAVIILNDGSIHAAHRGEKEDGEHAEFTLLQKKLRSTNLTEGATLYTTLEPCTTRSHHKLPCADWIVEKKIRKVVIGLLDPNPSICGKGYWHLLDANVQVEFFPHNLAKQIAGLNTTFIQMYRSHQPRDVFFAELVQQYKNPVIAPFPGFGFGTVLEIQPSPNLREGWPLSQVELHHDDENPFILPPEHEDSFKNYYSANYDCKRFVDDGEKFMLDINPTAFEEAPTLQLRTRPTQYSKQHFYRDVIAKIPSEQKALIKEFVTRSLKARFPHSCSLQMVVVTRDKKILLTERSTKVGVFSGSWSCSVEEDLRRQDIEAGPASAMLAWGKRLLSEELKLSTNDYYVDDLRVLSIFLEGECLNVSFCVYGEIRLSSTELDSLLRVKRGDIEFTNWAFLDLNRTELLREIFQPSRVYHPSSGYRMLKTFLKFFGEPEESEIRKFSTFTLTSCANAIT